MNLPEPIKTNITDESFANGIVLNDLDDWAGFHERLVGGRPLDGTNRIE